MKKKERKELYLAIRELWIEKTSVETRFKYPKFTDYESANDMIMTFLNIDAARVVSLHRLKARYSVDDAFETFQQRYICVDKKYLHVRYFERLIQVYRTGRTTKGKSDLIYSIDIEKRLVKAVNNRIDRNEKNQLQRNFAGWRTISTADKINLGNFTAKFTKHIVGLLWGTVAEICALNEIELPYNKMKGLNTMSELFIKMTGVSVPKEIIQYFPDLITMLMNGSTNRRDILKVHQGFKTQASGVCAYDFVKKKEDILSGKHAYEFFNAFLNMQIGASNIDHTESSQVYDYVRLCNLTGIRVNVDIKSTKRLTIEHDKATYQHNLDEINKVPDQEMSIKDKFKLVDGYKSDEIEIELISNERELLMEGMRMNHCVNSYKSDIKNGSCAIFKIFNHQATYTLEVKSANNSIYMAQIRGRWNAKAPDAIKDEVSEHIKAIIAENDELNPKPIVVESRARNIGRQAQQVQRLENHDAELPF
jgi:hypothetical protein